MTLADKPVTRKTYSAYRGRPVIVTIHATWLSFRLAKTRKAFLLDVEAAYQLAAKMEAARARAEKIEERKQSRRKRK